MRRICCFAAAVLTLRPAAGAPLVEFEEAAPAACRIEVRTAERAARPVSRYLYGKFTEHLWWNVYNGLWAQILKNPSFESWELIGEDWKRIPEWIRRHGFPERFPALRVPEASGGGVAPWWVPWGRAAGVNYSLDGEAFNSERCQRMAASSVEGGAGIEQPVFLPLHRETRYRLALYAKGTARLRVSVQAPSAELAAGELEVDSAGWGRRELELGILRGAVAKGTPLLLRIELAAPGAVWLDQITLFPADHVEGFDPDIVRLLRESRLPLLRFPGGNFVSGYRWEDGIGPVERRPTRRNPAWGDFEPNHVGMDEYMRLCKLIGCEPLICVNAGDGTAREAANWVEYANGPATSPYGSLRARNGHPEPYWVRFWEIGNELYGSWQIGHCTAEEYAERYAAFYEAMRAVDPEIHFLAIGQDEAWSAPLIARNGKAVRTLAIHELPGGGIPPEAAARDVFEELMAFPVSLRAKLRGLGRLMQEAGLKPSLAITEAQIFTNRPGLPTNSTQAESLFLAGLIHTAIREGELVEMITHSGLVNHAGGLRKQREVVFATPVHYASLLYGTQSGVFPAGLKATVPHYRSAGRYLRQTREVAVPLLDPVALVEESGRELTLIVLNRSPDRALPCTVAIEGFSVGPSVRTRTLDGESYLAQNTLEEPEKVALRTAEFETPGSSFEYRFPSHSLVELVFRRRPDRSTRGFPAQARAPQARGAGLRLGRKAH
jgi:alpha-N-arabinofuranosidase